jgi:zinc-ribbon domain
MVSDYDTALTIGLKPISPASTLATFEYAVEQLFTAGEMQALEREAEAVIAVATAVTVEAFCPSCGAETAGDVRFCRVCGKPIAQSELPPELEVTRLTALASASQIEITLGLGLCLLTLLVTLPMILFSSPKGVGFGWIVLALGELLGSFFLALGLRRLHRALNSNSPAQQEMQPGTLRVSAQQRASLPPRPVSITEGTTELIDSRQPIRAAVNPVKDTDSLQ